MKELRPTLWRTCRVLAHPARLDLIKALFSEESSTVENLAEKTHLSKGLASAYLRAINARGLIQARQKSRYVFYSAEPNPNVMHAAEILNTLKSICGGGMDNEEIIHTATAFTHPRRIEIVKVLQHRSLSLAEIAVFTGISMPALFRHLGKLEKRNVVDISGGCHSLATPKNIFAHTLLLIALQ